MLDHKLMVKRKLANGNSIKVGELAENKRGIYFQYHDDYVNQYGNISPFSLENSVQAQLAPSMPHNKLHGVFADSLPDGWGLYLMDKVFSKNDVNPNTITPLERLAFIGDNCLGALYYEPTIAFAAQNTQKHTMLELGKQAVNEFEGSESHSKADEWGHIKPSEFEWESQVPAFCAGVAASPSLISVSTTFRHALAVLFLTASSFLPCT